MTACISPIVVILAFDRQADFKVAQNPVLLTKESIPEEVQEILPGAKNLFDQIDVTGNKDVLKDN